MKLARKVSPSTAEVIANGPSPWAVLQVATQEIARVAPVAPSWPKRKAAQMNGGNAR